MRMNQGPLRACQPPRSALIRTAAHATVATHSRAACRGSRRLGLRLQWSGRPGGASPGMDHLKIKSHSRTAAQLHRWHWQCTAGLHADGAGTEGCVVRDWGCWGHLSVSETSMSCSSGVLIKGGSPPWGRGLKHDCGAACVPGTARLSSLRAAMQGRGCPCRRLHRSWSSGVRGHAARGTRRSVTPSARDAGERCRLTCLLHAVGPSRGGCSGAGAEMCWLAVAAHLTERLRLWERGPAPSTARASAPYALGGRLLACPKLLHKTAGCTRAGQARLPRPCSVWASPREPHGAGHRHGAGRACGGGVGRLAPAAPCSGTPCGAGAARVRLLQDHMALGVGSAGARVPAPGEGHHGGPRLASCAMRAGAAAAHGCADLAVMALPGAPHCRSSRAAGSWQRLCMPRMSLSA